MDLYSAAQARYYEDKALDVSVTHPAKPREVLTRLMKAAHTVWGTGKPPMWTDPKRFRAWLAGRGAVIKDEVKE